MSTYSNEIAVIETTEVPVIKNKEITLVDKIRQLNRAVELMGRRGNSIRFDNYSWAQLLEVKQGFPKSKIEVHSYGRSGTAFYFSLQIANVILFSQTYSDTQI